jgi:small subunit ribosomal protein S16
MLKIRLQRVGRKHEPSFRLVLTDSKNSTKSGRFAEVLGNYDPRKSLESLKADRIQHWLARGAGLTGSVNNLLVKKGIIRGKKTHVAMDNVVKEKPVEEAAPSAPEASLETVPAEVTPEPAPAEDNPEASVS